MLLNTFCNRKAAVRLLCNQLTKTAGKSGQTTNRFNTQLVRVMRLTAIILLAGCLQVAAKVNSQTITFSAKNADLQSVFRVIEKQTDFTIAVNKANMRQTEPVNVDAVNMPLEEFLSIVFKSQPLVYNIKAQTIFLSKKVTKPTVVEKLENVQPPITGVVKDSTGMPLAGATVTVRSSKKSVQTNAKGEFTIDANEGDELIISYIGFESTRIRITGENVIAVLRPSNSPLDEVQIRAYGMTSRRINPGSIYTIKGEEIAKQPVTNPLLALQGRVPNLVINPTSGLPGGAVNLQLRGQNSLSTYSSQKSEPLIIIDGVPFQNNLALGTFGSFGIVGDRLSALRFLNVNDIEQIDVLADAEATSIYGSRGANGVILVTTKRGKSGRSNINVSFSAGISEITKKLTLLSTPEYIEMRKKAYSNNGLPIPDKSTVDKDFSNYDLTVWDASRYTDWQEEFLGRTATSYMASASVNGGNSAFQYLFSGNYSTQELVFPGNNKDETGSVSLNINTNSNNQKLRVNINGSYNFNNGKSTAGDLTVRAVSLAPNAPAIYNTNGSLNWEPDTASPNHQGTWLNPYAQLLHTSATANNNLRGAADVNYEIAKNLIVKVAAGYSEVSTSNLGLTPIASFDPAITTNTGSTLRTNVTAKSISFEPQISYETELAKGRLQVLAGASFQKQSSESVTIYASGYTTDALLLSLNQAPVKATYNNSADYKYSAGFGRLNYNWQNKYTLSLSARRDGSSRFGPGYQFGNFWSVGSAWIFTEENILKKYVPVLSFGKVRFSYGTSGNDGIGDYRYLELYEGFTDANTYQGQTLVRSTGASNSDYHWETVKKLEAGIELGFFKDRVLISASYWRTKCGDQLGLLNLAATTGADVVTANQNAGIQNMGWDFLITAKNIVTKKFTWQTSANFGLLQNKLLSLPAGLFNGYFFDPTIVVGGPFSGFASVYEFKGINQANGYYQFTDKSGNVTSDKDNENPWAKRINTRPLTLGLSNSITLDKFSLSIFAQLTRQMGRNYLVDRVFNSNPAGTFSGEFGSETGNRPREFLQYWEKPGDLADFQKLSPSGFGEPDGPLRDKLAQSDFAWVDASFIRIRSISLSYNIRPSNANGKAFQKASIFLQGDNLITITSYKGLDPQVQSATSLPMLRTIVTGIQITF